MGRSAAGTHIRLSAVQSLIPARSIFHQAVHQHAFACKLYCKHLHQHYISTRGSAVAPGLNLSVLTGDANRSKEPDRVWHWRTSTGIICMLCEGLRAHTHTQTPSHPPTQRRPPTQTPTPTNTHAHAHSHSHHRPYTDHTHRHPAHFARLTTHRTHTFIVLTSSLIIDVQINERNC